MAFCSYVLSWDLLGDILDVNEWFVLIHLFLQ